MERKIHVVITHIPLQFQKVRRPPGAEMHFFPSPCKEILADFRKRTAVFEILHIHMKNFLRAVMKCRINGRSDSFMKPVEFLEISVQFNGSDFQNFKRKTLFFFLFPIGTLVPFQIKNNVGHKRSITTDVQNVKGSITLPGSS